MIYSKKSSNADGFRTAERVDIAIALIFGKSHASNTKHDVDKYFVVTLSAVVPFRERIVDGIPEVVFDGSVTFGKFFLANSSLFPPEKAALF